METYVLAFGAMLYGISALISAYIAAYSHIDNGTHWRGRVLVYYGMFNIAFWTIVTLSLVLRKIVLFLFV